MKENEQAAQQAAETAAEAQEPAVEDTAAPESDGPDPLLTELEALKDSLAQKEDQYLRLAAEYDNYRRRTQKEKADAYTSAKSDAVLAFLPVYDNLERALKQETADAAYKKGVEMTMTGLKDILSKLGVEEIPALGQTFDPNLHNAVMHVEDDSVGENTVVEVFQTGFQSGDKVIRFAMVKVAN
ncbi:nucleotide exchange factor GrpE [Pseudoflavonifractor sp. MSJ-37]|nr:nucleotide exchange factor GrpE [Pseudoflavonifractor sp. MSJ-37]MBU5434544.1 nucleotide exchange factor GrpE [Pseudoflavonifractor sp. MSJ-37]